jgi:hypothetical protein
METPKFDDLPKQSQEIIKIANYVYSQQSELNDFSVLAKDIIFKEIVKEILSRAN